MIYSETMATIPFNIPGVKKLQCNAETYQDISIALQILVPDIEEGVLHITVIDIHVFSSDVEFTL